MDLTYSADSQRYRDASGRFIANSEINTAVDRVIVSASDNIVTLTDRFQSGAITLDQWQAGMVAELKPLHLGAAMIGRGGQAQMTFGDWGWTGQRLRTQYGYLRNFAQQIATGAWPMDGRLAARAAMYAEAARATHREMIRRVGMMQGRQRERNLLGAAENHCPDCPELSSYGWVPIGTLPPVGGRSCRSRCRCTIVTRMAA